MKPENILLNLFQKLRNHVLFGIQPKIINIPQSPLLQACFGVGCTNGRP